MVGPTRLELATSGVTDQNERILVHFLAKSGRSLTYFRVFISGQSLSNLGQLRWIYFLQSPVLKGLTHWHADCSFDKLQGELMDRPIDPKFKRKQITKRVGYSITALVGLASILIWGPGWISPSLSANRIRTAKVDVGEIEATITASGTVKPEYEAVLSSPVDARVLRILKRPGELVKVGEPIIELDVSESLVALERLVQELEIKKNLQRKLRLDLQSTLIALKGQTDVMSLELKSLQLEADQKHRLYEERLVSEEEVRRVDVLKEKCAIELQQLQNSRLNAEESTSTQLEGLDLEMKILLAEVDETRRRLELATTKSNQKGVLTWVVEEEGVTIRTGDVVARIADLTSFAVEATISDVHANRIKIGLPVRVTRDENRRLEGTIRSIHPTIQDGIITLTIGLEEESNSLLRANLRVDVHIVTDRKERALRIKRGPFVSGAGNHDVFVIRGAIAVRIPVQIGISSFESYEVVSGLLEGDEVIISEMSDYMRLEEVRLK